MTRTEYLTRLERYLKRLPKEDYEEAMDYFREYFDEAGPENVAQVIEELGSPKEAASDIISNVLDMHLKLPNKTARNRKNIIILSLLGLFAAPIGLPIFLGLLFFLVSIFLVGVAAIITAYLLGLAGILVAGVTFFESLSLLGNAPSALAMGIGTSLASLGGGLLIWLIATAILRLLVKGLVVFVKWILNKRRK